jgi:hypothetical protein
LCVCHGSTRDPFRSSKSPRLIGLTDPSRAIFWTEHSGQKEPPPLARRNRERPRGQLGSASRATAALPAVATAQQETAGTILSLRR